LHSLFSLPCVRLIYFLYHRIDRELYRQTHKKEFEEKNRIKNNEVIEKILPEEFDVANAFEITNEENSMVKRKDKRLAAKNPQAYCADRCITTGNCDVFEDLFELSPVQVLEFCEECVLSEDEEPCDVPDKFYDDGFSSLQP